MRITVVMSTGTKRVNVLMNVFLQVLLCCILYRVLDLNQRVFKMIFQKECIKLFY